MAEDSDHLVFELQNILQKNPNLQFDSVKKKIRCSLSGHEMPCSLDIVNSYLQGKKYKKLCAGHQFEYDGLKPHIVQSNKKGREHQLFCLLTLRHINRHPDHVQRHINGHRFRKALAKWEECKRTGQEFKPYQRQKRRDGPRAHQSSRSEIATDMDMEGSDDESDVDSLSDLYPTGDFVDDEMEEEPMEVGEMAGSDQKENENNSESDYDFEDMNETDPSSAPVQGQKRKKEENSSKKLKSMKKRGKKNLKSHVS
ncbi:hypothetical protein CHS0354_031728 [Potamilus streckersoni]|uniref:Surfeit locus protein 2 n=1 Tax=Potamilus streckersoni TaxID=2493646 RepID=A0AAE0WAA6_9BIVA|nr:hypothetical protein CHS0354_031728 [Potamilus streckersoni]